MTSGPGDGAVQEHSTDPESTTPLAERAKKTSHTKLDSRSIRRTPWCLVSMNSLGTGFAFARHFAFRPPGRG